MLRKIFEQILPKEVPEDLDISPTEFSFFIVANRVSVFAFIAHAIFFGLFFVVAYVELLMWFNVASCLLYIAIYFLNQNGYYNLVLFLIIGEVTIHCILAVYYLGIGTGFQYYLIAIIPVIFFSALRSTLIKFFLSAVICVIYASLVFYSKTVGPISDLTAQAILNYKLFNIAAIFVIIAIPAYSYNGAVIETRKRLKELNKKLKKLALRDSLTNLLNRRAMNKKIEQKVAEGSEANFVIIVADIDDFKMVNDQYGHTYGDYVLKEVAELMKQELQREGIVSRWGGEEFLIFLPHVKLNQGIAVGNRLKEKIANHIFKHNGKKTQITITMGVSEYNSEIDLEECIREADQALYRGKQTGKNKVATY